MKTVHPGNLQCFLEVYAEKLKEALKLYPEDYSWPESELPKVLERMRVAIERGSFNKDGHALKATCKELKIKHTYKAIQEYISL
jgi:hypothetical protein